MGITEFPEFERGDFRGITYLDTYFVREGLEKEESLHFHELVHIVQWAHLGPERFLQSYVHGYSLAGGYRDNPLESIAFDLQTRFEQTIDRFSVEPVVRQDLDDLPARIRKGEFQRA